MGSSIGQAIKNSDLGKVKGSSNVAPFFAPASLARLKTVRKLPGDDFQNDGSTLPGSSTPLAISEPRGGK
jgi:hypothetical protein